MHCPPPGKEKWNNNLCVFEGNYGSRTVSIREKMGEKGFLSFAPASGAPIKREG
jgi:hypothetical protein